jgi:SNF2 family DNA or RNA helicase
MPTIRLECLTHFVPVSPKLKALLHYLRLYVLEGADGLIIWCNEPISLMLAEFICQLLQIDYRCIRAGVDNVTRVKAERAFNEDPDVRVMILSTRSASESANLQKGGNVQVFMDVVSYRVVAQCIGCIYRVGQERETSRGERAVVKEENTSHLSRPTR